MYSLRSKFNWELGCGQELVFVLFNLGELDPEYNVFDISANLRTVPTIVIAHTFCASPDTRISYR